MTMEYSKIIKGKKVWYYPVLGCSDRKKAVITSEPRDVCGTTCCNINILSSVVSIENLEPRLKRLKIQHTSQEQGKRLLKLGIPKWSADLSYNKTYGEYAVVPTDDQNEEWWRINPFLKPAWSVGRLIEIVSMCYTGTKFYYSPRTSHKIDFWLDRVESWTKIGFMDYSKLEE